ncbi:MAG: copper resistance protein B [Caulobacterales bacterium]|nr:copper resistance protein B [Caulobacterales bacterium]
MSRLALPCLVPLALVALAGPAAAQTMDHSTMPGMSMPAQPAQANQAPPPPQPQASSEPPATDHAAMPGMDMAPAAPADIPQSPPPPAPRDHAADRFYSPAAMAQAGAQLASEHGGAVSYAKVMANLAEHQARDGADGYRWDGEASFGGDIHRLALKSEGEGTRGDGVEAAELQALYSRAVGPYTDVQAGVRQDFKPRARTYATVGFETLLPYWFEVQGAAFLSTQGQVLGRLEGTYDLRLTNRWILQPRAELNFAAQNSRETRTGSGLSNAELGLRLRYEIRREFAPYIGVSWDRKLGRTADYARARGEDPKAASVVVGLRAWF